MLQIQIFVLKNTGEIPSPVGRLFFPSWAGPDTQMINCTDFIFILFPHLNGLFSFS